MISDPDGTSAPAHRASSALGRSRMPAASTTARARSVRPALVRTATGPSPAATWMTRSRRNSRPGRSRAPICSPAAASARASMLSWNAPGTARSRATGPRASSCPNSPAGSIQPKKSVPLEFDSMS